MSTSRQRLNRRVTCTNMGPKQTSNTQARKKRRQPKTSNKLSHHNRYLDMIHWILSVSCPSAWHYCHIICCHIISSTKEELHNLGVLNTSQSHRSPTFQKMPAMDQKRFGASTLRGGRATAARLPEQWLRTWFQGQQRPSGAASPSPTPTGTNCSTHRSPGPSGRSAGLGDWTYFHGFLKHVQWKLWHRPSHLTRRFHFARDLLNSNLNFSFLFDFRIFCTLEVGNFLGGIGRPIGNKRPSQECHATESEPSD